jgi:predicted nucleic acid-binding protein
VTLVVSDNSPLNLLVRVGHAGVLPALFQHVLIPPEVAAEMAHPKAPAEVQTFIAAPPAWLTVRPTASPLPLPHLDPGEAAAISLAVEVGATLLIDERDGRQEAQARGLTVVGAVGVLEQAAGAGFVPDLAAVHAHIRRLRFHVSDAILQASLARHLARKAPPAGGNP